MQTKYQYETDPEYLAKGLLWLISTMALIIVGFFVHYVLPKHIEDVVITLSGGYPEMINGYKRPFVDWKLVDAVLL